MEKFEIYCGGEFRDTGEGFTVTNPHTGESVGWAVKGREQDLEAAIARGKELEKEARELPSFRKYEALMQIARELEQEREKFASILSQEAAKPWKYAVGEVDRAIATFIAAAEEAKRLPGEYLSIDWTPGGQGKEGWVRYFPLGLVAGIAPFNFPLNLAVHKIAPAIAAGCPIILKPSSSTPLSTLLLARVIHRTGLPKGMVSVLPLDRNLGGRLVTDDRIRLITFTGSPPVGWNMKARAGRKRVVLELGGNAGVIVSSSACLETAVAKCVTGAFSYSGQVCIHTQRIYVQRDVFSDFAGRFVARASLLKAGIPADPSTDISAMIDEGNAVRVEEWVNEALADGASLLLGGTRDGSFFPPTVLTGTQPHMKVCRLEIFGPVVTLEPYDGFDQAVARINEGDYGLQAGVFTNDLGEMNTAFNELEVGGVMINEVPTFRVDHMPYGGVKNSGFGREGVRYAMLDMLEPRLLVRNNR